MKAAGASKPCSLVLSFAAIEPEPRKALISSSPLSIRPHGHPAGGTNRLVRMTGSRAPPCLPASRVVKDAGTASDLEDPGPGPAHSLTSAVRLAHGVPWAPSSSLLRAANSACAPPLHGYVQMPMHRWHITRQRLDISPTTCKMRPTDCQMRHDTPKTPQLPCPSLPFQSQSTPSLPVFPRLWRCCLTAHQATPAHPAW